MHKILINLKNNLFYRLKDKDSLFSRVAKGGAWLGIGSGVENFLRLIRNIILARILLPEAFGIMAILLATTNFFESLTQVGINTAIIQHPEGDKETFLNAACFFSLARGISLFLIGFFLAPFIAAFYKTPELTSMLQVVFLSLLFANAMSIRIHVAYKKLNFKKWILIEQLGAVFGICTSVFLSLICKNVWGLIIGFVIESTAKFILSFIFCPYLPRLQFKKEHIKDLLKFTRGMAGIPIFTFIFMNADTFVIGKVLNQDILGLYSMALSLARIPSTFLQKFVFPLFMPAFSEIKHDIPRLNKINLQILLLFTLFGMPLIIFAGFYSKTILTFFYTTTYSTVATPFAILFAIQILTAFNTPIVSNYLAIGRPQVLRAFTILRALLVIIFIYPATKYLNLTGTTLAILVAMVLSYFFQILLLDNIIHIGIGKYFGQYLPGLIFSTPLLITGFMQELFTVKNPTLSFLIGCLAILSSYLLGGLYMIKKHNNHAFR